MKKSYLLLTLLCLLTGGILQAQQIQAIGQSWPVPALTNSYQIAHQSNNGPSTTNSGPETAVVCSEDTVQYAINKATGLRALNINNSTSASAGAQYFDAPQAITVSGFRFYAYSITTPTITVTAELYLAAPDSTPLGTPLATVSVVVDSSTINGLADYEEFANFTTPITVTQPYVLVVQNQSANGIGLICNDYTVGDGQAEWLASALIGANWLRGYEINVGGPNFDSDWLFDPFVTYDLNTTFTFTPPCLAGPNTLVTFTSTSSPILSNRMYNLATFLGLERLSHTYDFGDGSPQVQVKDTTHNYVSVGTYAITKTDTMYGWSTLCINDTLVATGGAATAAFTNSPSGLTVVFSNTSSGASSAMWDFGDGNTSTSTSPTHTYASPGSYNVCLTATGPCGPTTVCSYVTLIGPSACGADSVLYPLAKLTGLRALSINNATSAQALSQYYNAPQPITIYGFEFFAWSSDLPVTNITCSIFTAGTDSMPTGTALATATYALDSSFGGGTLDDLRRFVGFSSPVTVSAPYVIVISNLSANNIAVASNDYTVQDGQSEWLSSVDLFGNWTRGYDVNVGGSQYNADWLLNPLVTYDLQASFSKTPNCLGSGGTVTFTNSSSAILGDRMYNQAAFVNQERLSYTWDFGDASPFANAIDTNHVYASAGPYTVTLTDTIFGWTSICTDDTMQLIAQPAAAAFSNSGTSLNQTFTDQSSGAVTSWFWDFGDGNTSTVQSPTHLYAMSGNYTVCLTVADSCGSDSTCQIITITCPVLSSQFTQSNTNLNYSFTDQTVGTPTSWLWTFGDGNTSTSQSPTHAYTTPGNYTVCLTTTDGCSTDSSCVNITASCPAPTAAYSANSANLTTNFTDLSSGTTVSGWLWDFGDGNTSTLQNPSNVYANPGTYTVCLTVTDLCGSDSTCMPLTVTCAAPTAFFTNSTSQLSATFTDASSVTGSATYAWDFGDGNTSTVQSPTHTYTSGGLYTVCLVVSDICGADTICLPVSIVCPVPTSFFSSSTNQFTASFTDQSSGTGTITWAWDFGDGNSSTVQNPSHTYAAAGNYTVCLVISDDCGSDTTCLPVNITCPAPTANFSSSTNMLAATFTDLSTGTGISSWFWDFGDGNTSTVPNGANTYATAGTYQVCLTVTDSCGSDSSCQSVTVMMIGIDESLAQNISLFPNPAQNQVNISLDLPSIENVDIAIFNPLGKQVREFKLEQVQRTELPIDLSDLSNGSYLVTFRVGDKQVVKRLNVVR